MKANSPNRTPGSLMDAKSEEWVVGFRIGLVLAEQCMSEIMRKGGTIEVLDADRNVIFASRIRDMMAKADGGLPE